MLTTIIMPVPKSGCNMISPNTKNKRARIGITPFLISLTNLLDLVKYLLAKIIKLNLANSLGCTPKEPIPNQLLLPFLTLPIPGMSTKTNKIIEIKKFDLLYYNKIYNLFYLL